MWNNHTIFFFKKMDELKNEQSPDTSNNTMRQIRVLRV